MTPPDTHTNSEATDVAVKRTRRLVNRVLAGIFACLLIAAIAVVFLRYMESVGEARREVNGLADLLSEYLVIRLRGVDGALTRIGASNRRLGGPQGSDREWASAMRSAIAGVSGLSSLVVLDADGVVRHATVGQIRGLSWADSPVFQRLARGVPNLLVVGNPVTMVVGDQVLVPFGRALTDPRGAFVGAVVALLLPHQLRDFLNDFDLGQSGIAWVLLPTGDVLFRDGAIDATVVGSAEGPPLFAGEATRNDDGLLRGPLFADGAGYVTAYRRTAVGDLIIAVSIASGSILRNWQYEAISVLAFVTAAGALLLFAVWRINAAMLDVVAAADADSGRTRQTTAV
jgi:hypothetical protein